MFKDCISSVAGPGGVATRIMVHLIECNGGAVSQHCFRSLRRRAAVERNRKANFELQMNKLHITWEMSQQKDVYHYGVCQYEQQIGELQSEVQSLRLLLELSCSEGSTSGTDSKGPPTSADESSQTGVQTVDVGTSTEDEAELMVPISKVEEILEKNTDQAIAANEETTRLIVRELQQRHEAELAQLRGEIEVATNKFKLMEDEFSGKAIGEPEVCDWASSSDDDSSAASDDLSAGMSVKLSGLASRPELNGRRGVLVKYVLGRERWQVDFGADFGIKLIKSCNMKTTAGYSDRSPTCFDAAPSTLHQNDLCLQCDDGGSVRWDRVLSPTELSEFLGLSSSGAFQCSVCGKDTSNMSGNFGYVHSETSDGTWEERHLLNMIGDSPVSLQCLRCNRATIPCKYHTSGYCARGSGCAYLH